LKPAGYAALAVLLLALCGTIFSLQLVIDADKGEGAAVESFMYLPDPEHLKVASLGYEELVADLLWLKAVQNMGQRQISGLGYDWIYKALDTVTTLDPLYIAPYETGGLILTIVADKVDLSNKLLEKGVENNPDVWQLPFYLGFNYFYYLRDFPTAARYLDQAAKIDGSPGYLPMLVSRMYIQSENAAASLCFLQAMYDRTEDERVRASLLGRMDEVKTYMVVGALQKVVDEYEKRMHRRPMDIEELVRTGIIDRAPEEPNGGYFFIDKDGKVQSSKLKSHLGVYMNK